MHVNRYLWRLHEAHHSTPDVDWVGGSRGHVFENLITAVTQPVADFIVLASQNALIADAADSTKADTEIVKKRKKGYPLSNMAATSSTKNC